MLLDRLCIFHRSRQSGKIGPSIFTNHHYVEFFRQLIANPNNSFTTHTTAIYLNSDVISVCLGIVCNDQYFYWLPSFDSSIKSISIGKLHIASLLEFCCLSEFSVFDFMGGSEPYKLQWPVQTQSIYRYDIFSNSILSFISRAINYCKTLLYNQLKRQLISLPL